MYKFPEAGIEKTLQELGGILWTGCFYRPVRDDIRKTFQLKNSKAYALCRRPPVELAGKQLACRASLSNADLTGSLMDAQLSSALRAPSHHRAELAAGNRKKHV